MDEYYVDHEEYYTEFDDIIIGGNCEMCPYYLLEECHLQCEESEDN